MFSINKYKYVDVNTRNKFEVFARDVNFADRLIERINNLGVFNLRRAKFRFCRKMATDLEPYRIEQEQEETVKGWEEKKNG